MRVFVQNSEIGRKVPTLKRVSGKAVMEGRARGRVTTLGRSPSFMATTITEVRPTGRVAISHGRQVMRRAEKASSGLVGQKDMVRVRREGPEVLAISVLDGQGSATRSGTTADFLSTKAGRGLVFLSTGEGLRRTVRAGSVYRIVGEGGRVRSLAGEKVTRRVKVSGEVAILVTTVICLAGGRAVSCQSREGGGLRPAVICHTVENGRVSRERAVSTFPVVLAIKATAFQVAQPIRSSPEKAPTASIVAPPSLEVISSSATPVDSVAVSVSCRGSFPETAKTTRSGVASGRLLRL